MVMQLRRNITSSRKRKSSSKFKMANKQILKKLKIRKDNFSKRLLMDMKLCKYNNSKRRKNKSSYAFCNTRKQSF